MRTKLLLFCCLLLTATACRKEKDDGGGGGTSETTAQKVSTLLKATDGAAAAYKNAWTNSADSLEALDAMCSYLVAQSTVEAVYVQDIDAVRVQYKNGLWGSIVLQQADAAGGRLTRGGPDGKPSKGYTHTYTVGGHAKGTASSMNIGNNKVLVFAPYFNEFYGYGVTYPYLSKFDDAPQELEVTVVTEEAATLDVLKTAKDYGFIILNTHGSVGGFMLYTGSDRLDELKVPQGPELSESEVEAALADAENLPEESLEAGEVELSTTVLVPETPAQEVKVMHAAEVRYTYIRAKMPMLDEAVVYGNHCYSGWAAHGEVQNNLSNAWMNRGAISYYGYQFPDGVSAPVLNDFCKRMEDSLISNLMRGDSTGVAHLADDVLEQNYRVSSRRFLKYNEKKYEGGSSYNTYNVTLQVPMIFRHFHQPTYSYGCGTLIDPRDGQKYKLACIGDQVWMAENLRYNAPGSRFYDDNPANGPVYGKLYTFSTMMAGAGPVSPTQRGPRGICPEGWHLPSLKDFAEMRTALIAANGSTDLGVQLKAKNNAWLNDLTLSSPLRDESGMAFMPAGALDQTGASSFFWGKGQTADFYLASPYSSTTPGETALIFLQSSSPNIGVDEVVPGDNMRACRCLKD